MTKQKNFAGVVFLGMACSIHAATRYVDPENSSPQAPYTSWETAATTIQAAVDAASDGDTVWVADGNYDTGGKVVGSNETTNRLVIDKAIAVQSVNGPEHTAIVGESSAVRCVWMGSGALLGGFALSHGNGGDEPGGGVWADSTSSILSNCVVRECSSSRSGGGMHGGQAIGCIFFDNSAKSVGGGSCRLQRRKLRLYPQLRLLGGRSRGEYTKPLHSLV